MPHSGALHCAPTPALHLQNPGAAGAGPGRMTSATSTRSAAASAPPPPKPSPPAEAPLLSAFKPACWDGLRVQITTGDLAGRAAVVLSTRSGWVTVQPAGPEGGGAPPASTRRRATDLRLLGDPSGLPRRSRAEGDDDGAAAAGAPSDVDGDDEEEEYGEEGYGQAEAAPAPARRQSHATAATPQPGGGRGPAAAADSGDSDSSDSSSGGGIVDSRTRKMIGETVRVHAGAYTGAIGFVTRTVPDAPAPSFVLQVRGGRRRGRRLGGPSLVTPGCRPPLPLFRSSRTGARWRLRASPTPRRSPQPWPLLRPCRLQTARRRQRGGSGCGGRGPALRRRTRQPRAGAPAPGGAYRPAAAVGTAPRVRLEAAPRGSLATTTPQLPWGPLLRCCRSRLGRRRRRLWVAKTRGRGPQGLLHQRTCHCPSSLPPPLPPRRPPLPPPPRRRRPPRLAAAGRPAPPITRGPAAAATTAGLLGGPSLTTC